LLVLIWRSFSGPWRCFGDVFVGGLFGVAIAGCHGGGNKDIKIPLCPWFRHH
jgi:hypothetical protein